jgi:hypothetical protein
MRRYKTTALAASVFLSAAALAASTTTATATTQTDTCGPKMTFPASSGVIGTLSQCTWNDGRIRVFGHLRDTVLSDGATAVTVRIGLYSSVWIICGSDTPVDTGYQAGGPVSWGHKTVSADRC